MKIGKMIFDQNTDHAPLIDRFFFKCNDDIYVCSACFVNGQIYLEMTYCITRKFGTDVF